MAAHGLGGPLQGSEGHGVIVRIKEAIKRRAAGVHAPRHLGFRHLLLLHSAYPLSYVRGSVVVGCLSFHLHRGPHRRSRSLTFAALLVVASADEPAHYGSRLGEDLHSLTVVARNRSWVGKECDSE